MDEGQKYFGERDIKPDFLTVKNLEQNPEASSAKTAEKEASFYESTAKNPTAKKAIKFKKSTKNNRLKKSALALGLIGIVLAVVFIALGSNSFLGPHLESLFTEATSTDYTAYSIRSNEIIKEILEGKLEMPEYLKERLEKNDIKVISSTTLEYKGQTITADNFLSLYNSNVDFREALTYARRGRIAMFFDSAAENFYNKLGLSRDVFHDDTPSGDNATDTAYYRDKMTTYFDVDAGTNINTAEETTEEDEEGNEIIKYVATGESATSSSATGNSAKDRAINYLDSISEKVTADTPGCAALEIGNMVATAISANNNYTAAHEYMTKMEPISKSRYINNDGSAINSVLNWFTKVDTATVYDAETGEEIEVTGSPLESEGMRVVLGGLTANTANTKKYSLERSFTSTNRSINLAGLSLEGCPTTKASGTSISLSATANPGTALIRTTIGLLLHYTLGEGVQIVASSVLGLLVPTISQVMFENPFENAVGIAGGESFAMGAANINQLSAQQNSGATIASREQALAYNHLNNQEIALAAEIDRKNHSPFDASNKNTFLGSLTASLLPLATTTKTISTPLTTIASSTKTAIASLNPTYADGENTSFMTSFGTYCEKLDELGAAGNLYCKSLATHDTSVLGLSTDDPTYQAVIAKSIEYDENGRETIIKDSPLADYITFWMGRYSAPGIRDANIAHACEHRYGYIPILSDIADMVKPTSDYCESVADGSHYLNSDTNPAWNETEKYHQLYVLTNRVKTNLGFYADAENPIAAYQKTYEAEHPLDNSRAGYLARISGLEKSDAEGILALADYTKKLETYNPTLAYNFSDRKSITTDSAGSFWQQIATEEEPLNAEFMGSIIEDKSTTTEFAGSFWRRAKRIGLIPVTTGYEAIARKSVVSSYRNEEVACA
ncbi:hypothetical protein IKD60_03230 [Candidatus Saccharibacteria bacterium]|nr:hypothetical protein [Candidatus Saccharibacteria bacterium]